jgi:hypothetical protein
VRDFAPVSLFSQRTSTCWGMYPANLDVLSR